MLCTVFSAHEDLTNERCFKRFYSLETGWGLFLPCFRNISLSAGVGKVFESCCFLKKRKVYPK